MKTKKTKEDYAAAAMNIFKTQVKDEFVSQFGTNIWRATWALDTLIDYFLTVGDGDSTEFVTTVLNKSMAAGNGDWWDDYGWNGVVSLRAQELIKLDPSTKQDFIKNAINCWCYMYGPGWNTLPPDPKKPFVPYPNVCDWQTFITKKNNQNVGAPNVFTFWKNNQTPDYWAKLEPKYSPGGLWNSTSNGAQPSPTLPICGAVPELSGLQNTVTNSLFMILSLRLYILSKNPSYSHYFTDVNIDSKMIYDVWNNQLRWFDQWLLSEKGTSSLRYDLGEMKSILIRERAPIMKNDWWSPGFCASLGWLGDQGLMLGAYRETAVFVSDPPMKNFAEATYKAIIEGVWQTCWSNDGYQNVSIPVLRPWVQYTTANKYALFGDFPAGDDVDYQTGIAAYCRYVQQAMEAGYVPSSAFVKNMQNLAEFISDNGFNEMNQIDCDGFIPGGLGADSMTNWINQLAVLCLAIKMS